MAQRVDPEDGKARSEQQELPWYVKTPSARRLFAYLMCFWVAYRFASPRLTEALDMTDGQFHAVVRFVMLGLIAVTLMLHFYWVRKYDLPKNPFRRRSVDSK